MGRFGALPMVLLLLVLLSKELVDSRDKGRLSLDDNRFMFNFCFAFDLRFVRVLDCSGVGSRRDFANFESDMIAGGKFGKETRKLWYDCWCW